MSAGNHNDHVTLQEHVSAHLKPLIEMMHADSEPLDM